MENEKWLDLIDRQAVVDDISKIGVVSVGTVLSCLSDAKRVDAVEVVHGRWDGKEGLYQGKCSVCGYMTYDRTADWARSYWHYCPNCGAKMDEKE